MSKEREVISYGSCWREIEGKRDYCQHFFPVGEKGTPEALLCDGCGCHVSFHTKLVTKKVIDPLKESDKYGECNKNYGIASAVYLLDGCCEFMAAGEEGTPEAFSCAACGCHRNFHRKNYI